MRAIDLPRASIEGIMFEASFSLRRGAGVDEQARLESDESNPGISLKID